MVMLPPSRPASPTIEQMRRGIERLNQCITRLEKFDPGTVKSRWGLPSEGEELQDAIQDALIATFGHGTILCRRYRDAYKLRAAPVKIPVDSATVEANRQWLAKGKRRSLTLVKRAVHWLEEEIADRQQRGPEIVPHSALPERDLSKVFIVHGHDEGPREAVARFLEQLGIKPLILHEQASQNRTVIEKVDDHGEVGFAVVLMTPDDEGSVKGGTAAPRARQNVLLELGYFMGRLGRKRVCAFKRGEVEIPSDFAGVIAEEFDPNGGWRQKLAVELDAAGYKIDWNMVMRP